MAGPALPVNIDTTYADSGSDASVKLHQQYHDTMHGLLNEFDTTIVSGTNGQFLVHNGTVYVPLAGQIIVRWDSGTDTWGTRPTGAPFGVLFLSTNDPAATTPPTTGLLVGDVWRRHPDAV